MYESAFGLQRRPFSATPDAGCVFAPPPVRDLLDGLIQQVEQFSGIAILTGAPGTGKTLLCRSLIHQLAGAYTIAYLSSAGFSSRRALLQAVLYEVGLPYSGLTEQELRLELRSYLKRLAASQQSLILIVDEAHLLHEKLLEEIRLLANVSEEGQSPVRVVLVGQLPLEETLAHPALSGFSQVIGCHLVLEPLTHQESLDYLSYRLHWAGGDADQVLSREAHEAIARASNGLPRCLNQLADHSLLLAFVHESPVVELKHVEDALSDLKQLPLQWNEPVSRGPVTPGESSLDLSRDLSAEPGLAEPSEVANRGDALAVFDDLPLKDAFSIEIGGDDAMISTPDESDRTEGSASGGPIFSESFLGSPELTPGWNLPADAPHTIDHAESFPDPVESESIVSSTSFPLFDSSRPSAFDSGWNSAGGIVPIPGGSRRPVNLIEEEVVIDRYARIDSGLGAPAVEAALILRAAEMLQPQEPAASMADDLPLSLEAIRVQPERMLEDDVIPLVEEALSLEADAETIAAGQELQAIPPFDLAEVRAEETSLEEQLETEVFDICSEVRQSILEQLTPMAEERVTGDIPIEAPQLLMPEYDAVEPELPYVANVEMPTHFQHIDPPVAAADAVPKPNYKLIFSTLRKKIGLSRR